VRARRVGGARGEPMLTIADVLARGAPPVAAILRGLRPDEAEAHGRALIEAGLRIIEVPMNSPHPLESVRLLARVFDGEAVIGAGTVLTAAVVDQVADAGGRIVVSPNTDASVIGRAVQRGLEPLPGFQTPSEAFRAIGAGARRLKLFPAGPLGPKHLKAVKDVLPREVEIWAVGGAGADDAGDWLAAGAAGLGVGGSLYKPGDQPEIVGERARALVAAVTAARSD